MLTGFERAEQHHGAAVQPEPGRVQAERRRPARRRRHELALTEPGLPVPAAVAHATSRSTGSFRGAYRHRRVPLQPRRQRHLHQREPDAGEHRLRRPTRSPAVAVVQPDQCQLTNAVVLKYQHQAVLAARCRWSARSQGFRLQGRLQLRRGEQSVDPGSVVSGSWNNNQHPDPNNPGLGYSAARPGHRFFAAGSYREETWASAPRRSRSPDARHREHELHLLG